jgi:hypothetical protein
MDDFTVRGVVGGIRPMFFAVELFPVLFAEVFRLQRKTKKVSQQKVAIPSHHDEAFREGIKA